MMRWILIFASFLRGAVQTINTTGQTFANGQAIEIVRAADDTTNLALEWRAFANRESAATERQSL